ncbi:MAG: MFS transporter, partial [Candidatus Acidiferrum sp.]
ATISTAQAVIADTTTPQKRKLGMALIGAAFGIGFTFGPLIGAGALYLFDGWYGLIGYIAAFLSLIAFALGCLLLPETRRFGEVSAAKRSWFDTHAMRTALADPAVAPIVLTFFLATLGFANLEVTQSLLNNDALGFKEKNNFLVFAYIGFVLLVTQGGLYRRLAGRLSELSFMTLGLSLMGIGLLSLAGLSWVATTQSVGNSPLIAWLFASCTAATVGFAFFTPSAQSLISRRSDPQRQGEVLGVNQSAAAMARILGPIFGISLYKLTPTHVLPYVLGAALLLGMLPLIPMIRRGGTEDAVSIPQLH